MVYVQDNLMPKEKILFVDDEKITYGEILEKVDKLAGYLTQQGIKEGDRVVVDWNGEEFVFEGR